jgi:RNAse (barnase) inhibitor barstar
MNATSIIPGPSSNGWISPKTLLRIDANPIVDWPSFHDVFAASFGFPDFYGRNMDAWIDCLSDLDKAGSGMTTVHVAPGQVLALVIDHAAEFKSRCPEQFSALVECSAFVNWRVMALDSTFPKAPLLALAFNA